MTQPGRGKVRTGVSIVTVTKRPRYMRHVFDNYARQTGIAKELIIVLNNDKMNLKRYRDQAKKHKDVTVFQLPERMSLGSCLNFAMKRAKFEAIAKFDDDDFYASRYAAEGIALLKKGKADIVGKRAHYMYLKGKNMLILRFSRDENRYVHTVPGATLFIHHKVLRKVKFRDLSNGEDDQFCQDSRTLGFKVFSGTKRYFVAVRRRNSWNHTWIIQDRRLLENSETKIIGAVKNYKRYAEHAASNGR